MVLGPGNQQVDLSGVLPVQSRSQTTQEVTAGSEQVASCVNVYLGAQPG